MAYIIESIVFAAGNPVPVKDLAQILTLPGEKAPSASQVREAARLLLDEYAPGRHGIVFLEVAGGYQFRTARENAAFVRQVFKEKPARLGRATLETLAIVAYRQPATKAEIEAVRGVDADGALNILLAKRLIRIAGRKEAIGRPLLYATTPEFLEAFGLKDLRDLPALDEIAPPVLEEDPDAREAEDDEEIGTADDGGPDADAAPAVVGDAEGGEEEAQLADERRAAAAFDDESFDRKPQHGEPHDDEPQDGKPQDDRSQEDGEALGHTAQGAGEGGIQPLRTQPYSSDGSDPSDGSDGSDESDESDDESGDDLDEDDEGDGEGEEDADDAQDTDDADDPDDERE
jgi:segregation and condensation protein B